MNDNGCASNNFSSVFSWQTDSQIFISPSPQHNSYSLVQLVVNLTGFQSNGVKHLKCVFYENLHQS